MPVIEHFGKEANFWTSKINWFLKMKLVEQIGTNVRRGLLVARLSPERLSSDAWSSYGLGLLRHSLAVQTKLAWNSQTSAHFCFWD